jgi:arylsulfatase A-like enzyme
MIHLMKIMFPHGLKVKLIALLFLFSGLFSYAQSSRNVEMKRPNIIFILTDDQRWDALGVMGNPVIKTPNMDKLAAAGILFENAYVTTSICCVSRASILTGQYESRHKIHDFVTDLSPAALAMTYPVLLKKAGYRIGFIGKFGVGAHPPFQVFDFGVNTEVGKGPGQQPDYIMNEENGRTIHETDSIGHSISLFLDEFAQKGPFCLSVSFKAPHEQDGKPPKYIIQDRYRNYYKDDTIPEPITADPKYWNSLPDFFRTDSNFGRKRWKGLFSTPALYRENVKKYYQLITGVDDVIGRMVRKLSQLGLADKTIIIFMGDNGFLMGEHGLEGKWYGYEESIRVPLFIYDPRLPDRIKNIRARQIALNIDIAPTILGMAGIAVPAKMQGKDLIGILENKLPARKDFFYQHYFLGSPEIPREEGVVTRDLKYMIYIEHHYEELYDIAHDPHETTNLVGDASYKDKLEELRKRRMELRRLVN